jgi:hypothetical protein
MNKIIIIDYIILSYNSSKYTNLTYLPRDITKNKDEILSRFVQELNT